MEVCKVYTYFAFINSPAKLFFMIAIFWRYDESEHCYYYNEAGTWLIFPPIFGGQFKVVGPADIHETPYFFDTLGQAKAFVESYF